MHSLSLGQPQSQWPGARKHCLDTQEAREADAQLQGRRPRAFVGGLAHHQAWLLAPCTVTHPCWARGFEDHGVAGQSSFPDTSTGEAGHSDSCSGKGVGGSIPEPRPTSPPRVM